MPPTIPKDLREISGAPLPHPLHAEEFDAALLDLAKVITKTARDNHMVLVYAPVIGHLVRARRIIQGFQGGNDEA
jgi:hypothetical protein